MLNRAKLADTKMGKASHIGFILLILVAFAFPINSARADVGPTSFSGKVNGKSNSGKIDGKKKQQENQQIEKVEAKEKPAPAKKQAKVDKSTAVKKKVKAAEAEESAEPKPWFDLGTIEEQLVRDTFQIHPRFRGEYTLDDNVLLESADEKMDSIFREIPGVAITIPFLDHHVKADYQAAFEQFIKFPRENTVDQHFKSEVALNFTDMYVRGGQSISHTSSRSGTTFTERVPRFESNTESLLGYKFNRFTVEGGYDHFYRSYDNTPMKGLNYSARKFHDRLLMDLTPSGKTKIFVEHALTSYNYWKDASRDGTGNEFLAGITGSFFPKTTLYSKFGFEHIEYEHNKDPNNFVAEVGALYKPLAKTTIDLGWVSDVQQATYATTTAYKEDKLFVRLRQGLTEKLSAESNFAYTRQKYDELATPVPGLPKSVRSDNLLTTDVKLLYRFNKWVSGDIQYQLNRRDSNTSVFDFTNNLMTVGLTSEI